MQNQGLNALVAVAVVAAVAAIFVSREGTGAPADPLSGKPVLPGLAQDIGDISHVTLMQGGQKTTLVRQNTDWAVEERGLYPAQADKVHEALIGLAELTFVEPKTMKPDLYSRLQVEDPAKKDAKSILVTVSDGKNSLLGEIIAGKHLVDQLGGGNDGIYVRKPGDAQSWLARGTLDLAGDTKDWLQKPILDLPADQVKDVELDAPDGGKLGFARGKPADKFALTTPPPAGRTVKEDDDTLNQPAGALAGLELSDVAPAKDFAFPTTGLTQAKFDSFDGLTLSLTLGQKDGNDWAKITATGTGDAAKRAADLTQKLSPWVYEIPSFKAKLLETKMNDVLAPPKGS
ncbi:MAG TPA: DUF4340 domain-containing protein [Stellaceae bacterium]|nr:DUF4340 domain-containing protein [Stellaceae bacterium]